ncbi:helix-turn-helix domain-containing protein [Actinopolymorpha sp. NPDC004070]|uniref:helix-turn-helix domain-containing protein n=1 Tax=Actinopolymorpha sp. NPDC004070 TaxID=3154548 RepID=UPI0033A0B19A
MQPGNRRRTAEHRRSVPRRGFSVAEVAEMFGASQMTVRRAIKAGQLRAFRLRGRVVVPAEAVEAMKNSDAAGLDVADATLGGGAA